VDRATQRLAEMAELEPVPIPRGWILAGAPAARAAELGRSANGAVVTVVSDCTAGEYLWLSVADETALILEGEALVEDGAGLRFLRPGDRVRFRAGAIVRWRVPRYVRKLSRRRDPRPRALRMAMGLVRRLREALTPRGLREGPLQA
jgi:uncharacterized cupin superfamily protein